MAAASKSKSAPTPSFENQMEASHKAQLAYLAAYEKTVSTLAESYERAAQATKVPWIHELTASQADLARELTKTYVGALRAQAA